MNQPATPILIPIRTPITNQTRVTPVTTHVRSTHDE